MWLLVALVVHATAGDGGLPPLEDPCVAKNAPACRALGQQLLMLDGGLGQAEQSFTAGCQLGDGVACRLGAELLDTEPSLPRAPNAVPTLLHDACEKGDARGCLWLADTLALAGTDARPALERAVLLSKKPCDANDLEACEPWFRASTRLKEVNETERARMVGRWCTRGAQWACSALADAYWRGKGVFEDKPEARRLAAEGCVAGMPLGCQVLAQAAMADGDWTAALVPAELACRARLPESCTIQGQLVRTGRGGDVEDEVEGEALLARGCRLGSIEGCTRLVAARTISDDQRRELMEIGCRVGSVPACAQRMAMQPALLGAPLEHALKLRCETKLDPHSCSQLGLLILDGPDAAKREVEARTLLDGACRQKELEACRELKDVPETVIRRSALTQLCDSREVSSCTRLIGELGSTGPRERSYFWQSWMTSCALDVPASCAGLRELAPGLRGLQARVVLDALAPRCRSGGLEACLTVEHYGSIMREDTRYASAVLCREGKTDRCVSIADAALRDHAILLAAWADAFACKQGNRDACVQMKQFAKPDFLALRTMLKKSAPAFNEARQWFEAAMLAQRFAKSETLPDGLTPFFIEGGQRIEVSEWKEETAKALDGWVRGINANGKAFVREADVCDRLTAEGVSHAALQLPVKVSIIDPQLHLEGARSGVDTASFELCEARWRVLKRDGTQQAEGPLETQLDFMAFRAISYTELSDETASSATQWPVHSQFGFGVDLTAGIPASDERFLVDTMGVRLKVQLVPDETLEWGVRVGLNLPTGTRNPLAVQLGIGTLFGVITHRPWQWRVVNVWVDLWALFEPFGFAVVPAVSTQVAFNVGKQELSVELGARMAIPVAWEDPSLRPRPFLPAPFIGFGFRPTF